MKRCIITVIIFLCCNVLGASEKTWTTDRPILEILQSAKENLQQYEGGDLDLKMLGFIKDVDLEVTFFGRTSERYYKFEVNLRKPVGKLCGFQKTLEVWGEDNRTTVRSTIDIDYGREFCFPLRWVNSVKDRIITRVEEKILCLEYTKLEQLTMPHVEQTEDDEPLDKIIIDFVMKLVKKYK